MLEKMEMKEKMPVVFFWQIQFSSLFGAIVSFLLPHIKDEVTTVQISYCQGRGSKTQTKEENVS